MRWRHLKYALGCVLLGGCGAAPHAEPGPAATALSATGDDRSEATVVLAGHPFRFHAYRDLEAARDVAEGAGRVATATRDGVYLYEIDEPSASVRIGRSQGLPSEDVTALEIDASGDLVVATAEGLVRVSRTGSVEADTAPPVGQVVDLLITDRDDLWACGAEGIAIARWADRPLQWSRLGESTSCRVLVARPDGGVVIGSSDRLVEVPGDPRDPQGAVMREHRAPEAWPRGSVHSLVALSRNRLFALLGHADGAELAYFDGARWIRYTVGAETSQTGRTAVGLAGVAAGRALLVTAGGAFWIDDPSAGELPLTPIGTSERWSVLSYRAGPGRVERGASGRGSSSRGSLTSSPGVFAPAIASGVSAPALALRPVSVAPALVVRAFTGRGAAYLVTPNQGVIRVGLKSPVQTFSGGDLVRPRDLQLASSASGRTWLLSRHGRVGVLRGGTIERLDDGEIRFDSIASGPQSAYAVRLEASAAAPSEASAQADSPAPVKRFEAQLYRLGARGAALEWRQRLRDGLEPSALPILAMTPNRAAWMAVRAGAPGTGRGAGALYFSRRGDRVVYHHHAAAPELDGEGALSMPDDIEAVDATIAGYAWFAGVSGAVRLGNGQAVVFGEARGVPGEVVTDVAVAPSGRVWIAAAEALGFYEQRRFNFQLPAEVRRLRPHRLAVDGQGHLWGVGAEGVVYHDGNRWTVASEVPSDAGGSISFRGLRDVEVDGAGRVWMLGRDVVYALTPVR